MKNITSLLLSIISFTVFAQGNPEDYYYEIPEYPENYSAGTVAARIVDGLGFRYYWATEGLRAEDLSYRPSDEARNLEETMDHIVVLAAIMKDATGKKDFERVETEGLTYEEKREMTLEFIKEASENLKSASDEDINDFDMVFSPENQLPFWNLLNGPIADAINHLGQIVTFRRTAGNPINQNISVMRGKLKSN